MEKSSGVDSSELREYIREQVTTPAEAEEFISVLNAEIPPFFCDNCSREIGESNVDQQSIFYHNLCKECGSIQRLDELIMIIEGMR